MERLAVIVGVSAQAIGVVWYISMLGSSVDENSRDIARHEIQIQRLDDTANELSLMNARIDENIKAIRATLEAMAK